MGVVSQKLGVVMNFIACSIDVAAFMQWPRLLDAFLKAHSN